MNVQSSVNRLPFTPLYRPQWILTALAAVLILVIPIPAGTWQPASREVHIAASQYEYGPAVISVNKGDRVTIELASADVVHGLYLDGYDLEITADPGQPARLTFIADKSGVFRFRCSVTCGPLHPFMTGKLKVGRNSLLLRGIVLAVLAAAASIWGSRR